MPKKKPEPNQQDVSIGDSSSGPEKILGKDLTREEIAQWFEKVLAVQRMSLGETDFYQQAADAVVELIGLDEGIVLLAKSDVWSVVASSCVVELSTEALCRMVLEKVIAEKVTYFDSQVALDGTGGSASRQAFVAAPIMDNSNSVVGVLFGSRSGDSKSKNLGIDHLEALVVQLLAGVISSGLIGEDRQEEVSRFQMQLEQFASPDLVRAMKDDVEILEAREREITVMFSDIRGFTGLTQRVGAEKTFLMIRNLMNQLARCILDEDGFIMGYAGDGIAAMWNAPADQPDHSELACWAAINMQKVMAKLSEFWNYVTGEELETRIGISTGVAHVGNAGSRWRMNYTALGPCVNLASRLEGANKYFGTSILINQLTKERLFSRFALRRIGPVIVKGMDKAEQVYELKEASEQHPAEMHNAYDHALKLFEWGKYTSALDQIGKAKERWGDTDLMMDVLKTQIELYRDGQETGTPAIKLLMK